jgi:hypothetical protein
MSPFCCTARPSDSVRDNGFDTQMGAPLVLVICARACGAAALMSTAVESATPARMIPDFRIVMVVSSKELLFPSFHFC